LLYALHGNEPGTLPHLGRESKPLAAETASGIDRILFNSVKEWVSGNPKEPRTEPDLTKSIAAKIEAFREETGFHADDEVGVDFSSPPIPGPRKPRIDILLTPQKKEVDTEPSTPFAVIEVGRFDSDWWKKLDQCTKYLDKMLELEQNDPRLRFDEKPLICAVLTIQGEETAALNVKLGAFLCSPRRNDRSSPFRLSLLWNISTASLEEASNAFGRLLRATASFAKWRDCVQAEGSSDYRYLSARV
jgi:hypothetical protein